MEKLIQYINSIIPVSESTSDALRAISTTRFFKRNTNIQPIGHTCKTIYFVDEGALRIYYMKENVDITESFEFENTFVARVESLFTGQPSHKAIQAIEDSTLVAINSDKLFALY